MKAKSSLFLAILISGSLCLADPITFTFQGTASGAVNSVPFSNASFTFTQSSDTSLVASSSIPGFSINYYTPFASGASIAIAGFGAGSISTPTDVADSQNLTTPASSFVAFALTTGGDVAGRALAFATYNTQSTLGPINTPSAFVSNFSVSSSLGTVSFSSVSNLIFTAATHAQTTAPSAGLTYLQTIPIPNWATSGSKQANYDLFAFNPRSRVMYVADRVNHSVTAIDTISNSVIGILPVPGAPSLNGVLVVPDLQQLVVTDGRSNVFVYDLRVPGLAPDQYSLPGVMGTDALDYDPFNHSVYVINGTAPYYMSGIDLLYKTASTQLLLPGSPELNRFNPNDGLIYQVITAFNANKQQSGVVAYDPVANSIRATYNVPCVPHGIDIDPVANVALLGCGTNQAQIMLSLKDGSILKMFPDVTGTDLLQFNPNNRRFYVGASGNVSTSSGCPADTTKATPIIGVIDAGTDGKGRLIGVTCTGRNAKLGIDPIDNFIYVGTRQYPANPTDANTGQPGVLVLYDGAPSQPITTFTQAALSPAGSGAPLGTLQIYPQGRRLRGTVILPSVPGMSANVTITTTVGYEVVPCGIDPMSGIAFCDGPLIGDPLIGGVAAMAVNGAPYAQGIITAAPHP
jgi:hypothetical protein